MKTLIVSIMLIAVVSGCGSEGSHQWFETANPCTKFTMDPISKKITFYSNDGRAMKTDKLTFAKTADGYSFDADGLVITERSVENREANVAQVSAIGIAMAQIATANWSGAAEFMSKAVGVAAVLGHRSGATGGDISEIQSLIDAAKGLNGEPAPTTQPTE